MNSKEPDEDADVSAESWEVHVITVHVHRSHVENSLAASPIN
jgi:hypothetical protein